MGRKELDNKANQPCRIYLTAYEKQTLTKQAEELKVPVSTLLRLLACNFIGTYPADLGKLESAIENLRVSKGQHMLRWKAGRIDSTQLKVKR